MTDSNSNIRSVLIIGCGYLGRRAAEQWHATGVEVSAVTRSPETAAQFSVAGWQPIQLDLASPSSETQLPEVDAVLWAVGYDRTAGVARDVVWIDGLKWVLKNLKQPVKKFMYVSSTSVYGNVDVEQVTEDTPANPVTEGGQCCLQAEQLVLNHFAELDAASSMEQSTAVVLRLAGIYGPDRLLRRIMDLKQEVPLPGDPDHWLNLIHVDDAAALVRTVAGQPVTPNIVNVANTGTVVRRDYYQRLAELSKSAAPVFGSTNATGRARSANKKVGSQFDFQDLAEFKFNNVLAGLDDAFARSTIVN
ncbi:MAG: NAD-dependent epimerase/dehydratase family protein [Fuerstiella sp.]